MKYQELISIVARLGFEKEIEDEYTLRSAVTRGLYTIFNDRPSFSRRSLVKRDHGTILISGCFTHNPREPETFSLPPYSSAFSFAVYGEGAYSITSGAMTTEKEFSGKGEAVKDFYSGRSTITFLGDCSYTVVSLAAFKNVFGKSIGDIPLARDESILSLNEHIPDFLAPAEAPRDRHGEVIVGAEIEGDRLILPDGFSGEVNITYRRKPKIPVGDYLDDEIDVPAECTELLPLIVASYVWLDDEPERSQYYLSLYKDGINGLRRFAPRQISSSYETNGWA